MYDRVRRCGLLFCIALSGGVAMSGYAAYLPAKAWLAQQLLDRAWQTRLVAGEAVAPWPWADTVPLARLRQARLGVEQIVLAGSSGRVLAFGPGHITGTARPGRSGNVVISGHRDTHFRWLADLLPNDEVVLQAPDGDETRYRVQQRDVHHESESALLADDGADRLRLITCYPFDAVDPGTPWRWVVTLLPLRR